MRRVNHPDARLIGTGVSAVLLSLFSVACGAASNTSVGFGSCPRHIQDIFRTPATHRPTGAVAPNDPLAGQVCVYSDNKGAPSILRFSGLLPKTRARTLVSLLDQRGGRGYSCDGGDPALIRLRYQSGRVLSTHVVGCHPELVSTPAGLEALPPAASLAVEGLIDPPLTAGPRVTRVPDYIGLPLPAAARAFGRRYPAAGQYAEPVDEVEDPSVPFGQVVWQLPLPGSQETAGQASAEFFVAVHSSPPCQADQLSGRFRNGEGLTGGQHTGAVELIDTSAHPCSLRGPITIRGLGSNGRADTRTVSEPVRPTLVLSPDTTLQTLGQDPAAALIAGLEFVGDRTNDPAGGPCRPHETVPKVWALTLGNGDTLRLPNGAPGEGGRFLTCREWLAPGGGRYNDVTLLGS